MSIWDSLFGGSSSYNNPADAAMPYLQNIPGMLQPYYQPYIDTGKNSMNQYYGQVSNLGTPGGAMDVYNQFGQGYTQSPGYQWNVDQQTQASNQAAAASGMAGTPSQQAALASDISGMAAQDYDNYMKMVTGLYDTGLGGLQDLTHLGYNASDTYASDLFKNQNSQAALAYTGQANQNMYDNSQNQALTSLFTSLASALAGYMKMAGGAGAMAALV